MNNYSRNIFPGGGIVNPGVDEEEVIEMGAGSAGAEVLEAGVLESLKVAMKPYQDNALRGFTSGMEYVKKLIEIGSEEGGALWTRTKTGIMDFKDNFEWTDYLGVEGLAYVTLAVVIMVCLLTITLNIYWKIRYAIPYTVNCWFCNTNSKVLYSLRDTWTCPKCQQYNGFTSDGDYNKRIQAQFMEVLNRPIRGRPADGYQLKGTNGDGPDNGLCGQCNMNQVMKVFQLSSFAPFNERNFDAEIEAEQRRLEEVYDICTECKKVVEETLKLLPGAKRPIKRKSQNVTPPPSTSQQAEVRRRTGHSPHFPIGSHDSIETVFDSMFKENSKASSLKTSSGQSFLSLDNLNIGTKDLNRTFSSGNTTPPYYCSPVPPQSPTSVYSLPVLYNPERSYSHYGSIQSEMTPLWKDYPLVQGGANQAYSVVDATRNCAVGRPTYITYKQPEMQPQHNQYNFQSSTAGSVFGGNKPLISPPKFCNGNTSRSFSYLRYPYYDVPQQSPMGKTMLNVNPPMASPNYFPNQISRTSSQSSGFVSQQGMGTPTPPPDPGQIQMQSPAPSPSTSFYLRN